VLSNGRYTPVDDPAAGTASHQGTLPFGINASGAIVGEYLDAGGNLHGFLLSGGQYGNLDDPLGVQGSFANGINDLGQVAGAYLDASGSPHGYVLSGGQFATVDDPAGAPPGQGSAANGINDSGQLVGVYFDAAGLGHGYLATPTEGNSASAPATASSAIGNVRDNGVGADTILAGIHASAPGQTAAPTSAVGSSAGPARNEVPATFLTDQLVSPDEHPSAPAPAAAALSTVSSVVPRFDALLSMGAGAPMMGGRKASPTHDLWLSDPSV